MERGGKHEGHENPLFHELQLKAKNDCPFRETPLFQAMDPMYCFSIDDSPRLLSP